MRHATFVAILAGCGNASGPAPAVKPPITAAKDGAGGAGSRTGSGSTSDLPEPAPAISGADLSGDPACGPFSSKDLTPTDVQLLNDRLRVRFLPQPTIEGDASSVRATVEKSGVRVFVGAREIYMQGDADFARHATQAASFSGTYDPVTIPGRDGKVSIVAGLLKSAPAGGDVVAVAHGWFLNGTKDVLDVAVFASGVTATNLASCRLFAEKVLATVAVGSRTLGYGTGAAVETNVSYATFKYTLPTDWILSSTEGIHDFARMTFRRRGSYPNGFTELQLGLDSHPGDWSSPGAADGSRPGTLFGLAVTWNQTSGGGFAGAWTVSTDVVKRDHAVASITSGTAADRDAAIQFAASVTTK